MLFYETFELFKSFVSILNKEQIAAISDDRLCIWKFINDSHFPTSLIRLFETTVWGLYGVKIYIYAEEYKNRFEEWSYFFYPKGTKEDNYYQGLIKNYNYEIDLKFWHPSEFDLRGLHFMGIPLVLSPRERTANPELIHDFLSIDNINDFIQEISNHSKYHTFFMTSTESLESGYYSNQTKLYGLITLYKYFLKMDRRSIDHYDYVKNAFVSEINKIRFHVELLKKALSFGFKTFLDIRSALNNRESPLLIHYGENLWNIEKSETVRGSVYKIYHRDDLKDFPDDAIMVAYNTNPEYMSAFLRARAVMVENTSQLSHTAITCREFNIQWVLWAIGCMNFKNGDPIEIHTIDKTIRLCQS